MKKVLLLLLATLLFFPVAAQEADEDDDSVAESEWDEEDEDEDEDEDEFAEEDEEDEEEEPYLLRIEVIARPKAAYIPVGDLMLEDGFFSWMHDGDKPNGYAVFMYPTEDDEDAIEVPSGAKRMYGKSFYTVEEAEEEITGDDTEFHELIAYEPVIDSLVEKLYSSAYETEDEEEEEE